MLSVSTLFLVFFINFISLGAVWLYVLRSYPNFHAARFWSAAGFVAAVAAGLSMFRGALHPLVPILLGGGMFIFAGFLASMGIQRLYQRPVMWRLAVLVTGASILGLGIFALWFEHMSTRILIYSVAQSIALLPVLSILFSRENGAPRPGARLTGYITILCIAIYWLRPIAGFFKIGGEVTLIEFNDFQAVLIVLLVFSSMAWNFGFLLMAIDRLRAEVAGLALLDDLTGAANRRQLQIRLDEECARSVRSQEPFSILMIDIDGFKPINDNHGHAAGDECLKQLTRAVQSRLRTGDLLARLGGDEFCVVLPSTTLREAAIMARRVLDACRTSWTPRGSDAIAMTASIGAAQWHNEIGQESELLIADADRALYAAKHSGKDCFLVFEPGHTEPLRKSA